MTEGTATFTPTHVVPADGLPAWAAPDRRSPTTLTLAPGTELEVVDRHENWAHVRAATGWQGWVNGTRLVAGRAPDPDPALARMLEYATAECEEALEAYRTGRLDDEGLREALLAAAVVNRPDGIWMLDLERGAWCRFDGKTVTFPAQVATGEAD